MFRTLQQEPNIDECFRAAERIRKALPQAPSIDEFLDNHRGNVAIERCGKLTIVRSILQAEKQSSLFVNPSNFYNELNFGSIEDTWFNIFWQRITANCPRQTSSNSTFLQSYLLYSIMIVVWNTICIDQSKITTD